MCWVIGPKNLITALSQSGACGDARDSLVDSRRSRSKVLTSTEELITRTPFSHFIFGVGLIDVRL